MSKFLSRKFLVSIAAFLASLGTSIAGFAAGEPVIATAGLICTAVSAAIYAAVEAYVDGQAAAASTTQKIVTASADSNFIVQSALSQDK